MWASVGPGPSSSSPKQCKLDGRVKIYNSVSARSPLTKSKKEKLYRAQQYKKRACQCTDGLSATQNGRGAGRRIQHCAGVEPVSPDYLRLALTTQPLVHNNCSKKTVYESSYYLNCFALLFWVQNCRSQIAQVEYQG